jgi:hypothetical protein
MPVLNLEWYGIFNFFFGDMEAFDAERRGQRSEQELLEEAATRIDKVIHSLVLRSCFKQSQWAHNVTNLKDSDRFWRNLTGIDIVKRGVS